MPTINVLKSPPKRGVTDGAYQPTSDKLRVVIAVKGEVPVGGGRYTLPAPTLRG